MTRRNPRIYCAVYAASGDKILEEIGWSGTNENRKQSECEMSVIKNDEWPDEWTEVENVSFKKIFVGSDVRICVFKHKEYALSLMPDSKMI